MSPLNRYVRITLVTGANFETADCDVVDVEQAMQGLGRATRADGKMLRFDNKRTGRRVSVRVDKIVSVEEFDE